MSSLTTKNYLPKWWKCTSLALISKCELSVESEVSGELNVTSYLLKQFTKKIVSLTGAKSGKATEQASSATEER